MQKRIRSFFFIVFILTIILTYAPAAMASITESNPEGFKASPVGGSRVQIDMSSVSPNYLNAVYDCYGIWDVFVNNIPQGNSLYFQQITAPNYYGINMFHPDTTTIDAWIKAFNGSPDFVYSQLPSIENTIHFQGNTYTRIYLRDLAELCGMHYYDSIVWNPGNAKLITTNYPSATLTIPANVNPGGTINWTAKGQSYVKSIRPARVNQVTYTLKKDGTIVSTNTLATTSFSQTGSFTVPQSTTPGTKIKYELSVGDGVRRITTKTYEVAVVQGAVTSTPATTPTPVTPPSPPASPNYDPIADFTISNPSPVECTPVSFHDTSHHPGAANGEKIVKWQWTIQGQPGSTDQNTTATWNTVGTYSVTLRVEDQDGDSDSCTKSVVVGPAMPAAVITINPANIIIGRKIVINGDQSTAANGRTIQWDQMQWEFTKPDGSKVTFTGRYPVSTKAAENALINQTGSWSVRLKVKDSLNNESAWATSYFNVYPDKPPVADFWIASESLRNSYQGSTLTITDLSAPGTPDASLGDTITSRQWTLYYDANKDGIYDSSLDQTIKVGDTGKAAQITEASGKTGNDPNPVIKFAKTGNYKLELKVTESYVDDWTGSTVVGLSADTSSKTATDKEVTVINIAPTVDFSIKAKVPVDVQFATDYTVTDTKYNSLVSSDAGFKSTLTGASINPTTNEQKVSNGVIGENYSINVGNDQYTVVSQISGNWYTVTKPAGTDCFGNPYSVSYAMNLSTGQIMNNYIDPNVTPYSVYAAAIQAAKPPDEQAQVYNWGYITCTYNYTLQQSVFMPDGSILLWFTGSGNVSGYSRQRVVKLNPNLGVGYSYLVDSSGTDTTNVKFSLVHVFKDSNQLLLLRQDSNSRSLITAGDLGYFCLDSWTCVNTNTELDCNYGATGNGKYFVIGHNGCLDVLSANSLLHSTSVPTSLVPVASGCVAVLPWTSQDTLVMFQNVKTASNYYYDDAYLYLVNENTGAIDATKEYYNLFFPQAIATIGCTKNDIYTFKLIPTVLNASSIGIIACYEDDGNNSDSYYRYYSVIKADLSVGYTSSEVVDSHSFTGFTGTKYFDEWQSLNNNCFALHQVEDCSSNSNWTKTYVTTLVFNNNCSIVLGLPRIQTGFSMWITRCITLDNGCFYTADNNQTQMYSSSAVFMWQEPLTVLSPNLFIGFLVAYYNGSLSLLNINTGAQVTIIPHQYLYNNSNYLLCYGLNASGRDGTIRCYGQLQGLKYINQVLTSHTWDPNSYNFIVSVIDNSQYNDYAALVDTVVQNLQSNHVFFVAISPATSNSSIYPQAEAIIKRCDGGWWLLTNADMSVPLNNLAANIIDMVNDERGADNVVLVNEPIELKSVYQDAETDPAHQLLWSFKHDPNKLGNLDLCNSMGLSSLNGATTSTPPTSFDKAGTFTIKCKAQDDPVTNTAYLDDSKAGRKWSSDDGYLTILVHRRPIADFSLSSTTATMNDKTLTITDLSYDPDTITSDPEGKKGIRSWEWQYRNETTSADWLTSDTAPIIFPSKGTFAIRLKVQDLNGAWSTWTTKYVTVVNSKPVARFDAIPNPVNVNTACSLIDHSYDTDGDQLIAYTWTINGVGVYNRTDGSTFTVSWPSIGTYNVTLAVEDATGQWSDPYTLAVKVIQNNKPIASFTLPSEGYVGETFLSNGTGSYDPDAGDRVQTSYWQYKKPGGSWSDVFTQSYGDAGFLYFYSTPADGELGTWTIRLIVADTYGLESDPVEHSIEIKEGFEVGGYVTPNPGERARNMIVTAYAYNQGSPSVKLQISSMTCYIVHTTKQDGSTALPDGGTQIVGNMVFDPATTAYYFTFLVPNIVQPDRWPDDGDYYIRAVGIKNGTQKECLIPLTIKGNVLKRVYIKTRSW